jgi:hypothetical protein
LSETISQPDRVQSKGADPLGRWSYTTFNHKGTRKFTVITAYQPGKGHPSLGNDTVITQHVMLAGDFNDILGKESHSISKICRQFKLEDTIHYYHGQAPDRFAIWIDGCEILDYVLVSRALLPFINACGYEPFMANVPGDHRGMFVDFNTSALFGTETSTLAVNAPCRITSTNPNHVRIYIEAQHECLEEHNYVHRILHLQQNPNEELAESLDCARTRACLYADSKIPH